MRNSLKALLLYATLMNAGQVLAGASLSGTRLASCVEDRCVEVRAEKAFQSHLSTSAFLFSEGQITVSTSDKKTSFEADSIFYDSITNRLYLRGLKLEGASRHAHDGYYDLNFGRLNLLDHSQGPR